jgi:hypothetical protein
MRENRRYRDASSLCRADPDGMLPARESRKKNIVHQRSALALRASLGVVTIVSGLLGATAKGTIAANAAEPVPWAPPNVDTIHEDGIYPAVTQSQSAVASSDGTTIVVVYNDSKNAPNSFSGMSVSTDGGTTFTRLNPSPFLSGHGNEGGSPLVIYNKKLEKWFAGAYVAGNCGFGLWTSTDGLNWSAGGCVHGRGIVHEESNFKMAVDNTPTSPFYGRMYVTGFSTYFSFFIFTAHSDDGTTWTAVDTFNINDPRYQPIQVVSGPDGVVRVIALFDGGGGFNNRQNIVFRSTDGGATWGAGISMGAAFAPTGDALCPGSTYYVKINPIWRYMGGGQMGIGPNTVVHYAYGGKGQNANDSGDIYYIRSTDNGSTWSTPIVLNTDQAAGGSNAQWMPSLSVTASGYVQVYWYDRRNTTDGQNYEIWSRASTDNGLTWLPDKMVSSVLIPQPEQPDPNFSACYGGDYNFASALGNTHYETWTDGRIRVSGHSQQDVFFAAESPKPTILCCKDLNGDGYADFVWRDNAGEVYEWLTNGLGIVSQGSIENVGNDWQIAGIGDFNGDGKADIVWRNASGEVYIWLMNGLRISSQGSLGIIGTDWQIAGVGDFNGDGKADIVWRNASGEVYIWLMNGLGIASQGSLGVIGNGWQIAGVGDFNGDGKADILWRNASGEVYIWLMNGLGIVSQGSLGISENDWQIAGVGDFNGDGKADILWRNASGEVLIWRMNGLAISSQGSLGIIDNDWQINGVGDLNGDGKADILWRNISTGNVYEWLMNGISILGQGSYGVVGNDWYIE